MRYAIPLTCLSLLAASHASWATDDGFSCEADPSMPQGYMVQSTHSLPSGCESYAIRPTCAERVVCTNKKAGGVKQGYSILCAANRDAKTCPPPTQCYLEFQNALKTSGNATRSMKAGASCQRVDGGESFTAQVVAQAASPGPGSVPSKCDLKQIAPVCVAQLECADGASMFVNCHTEYCGSVNECMNGDPLFPIDQMAWAEFKDESAEGGGDNAPPAAAPASGGAE